MKCTAQGLTLTCEPGVLTALMGGSGAGKTTLMDVIAGRKTQGEITGDVLVNGGRPGRCIVLEGLAYKPSSHRALCPRLMGSVVSGATGKSASAPRFTAAFNQAGGLVLKPYISRDLPRSVRSGRASGKRPKALGPATRTTKLSSAALRFRVVLFVEPCSHIYPPQLPDDSSEP